MVILKSEREYECGSKSQYSKYLTLIDNLLHSSTALTTESDTYLVNIETAKPDRLVIHIHRGSNLSLISSLTRADLLIYES